MKIIAVMAAVPRRARYLPRVVASLAHQVDEVRVYLAGWNACPPCRNRNVRFIDGPNIGDRGRWTGADGFDGYVLCVDDDIIYPADYAETMVSTVAWYQKEVVVGVHARVFQAPPKDYFSSLSFNFANSLEHDTPVHVLGSGTLAYHTDCLRLGVDDFPEPNMSDVFIACLCERRGISRIAVARKKGWLRSIPGTDEESLFATRGEGLRQSELIRGVRWHQAIDNTLLQPVNHG